MSLALSEIAMGPFEKRVNEASDPGFAKTYRQAIRWATQNYQRLGFTDEESPGLAAEDVSAWVAEIKAAKPGLNAVQISSMVARKAKAEFDATVRAMPRK